MNTELLQGITKDLHYEQLFSDAVIELIKELYDVDHSIEDCIDFITKFGEANFLEYYEIYLDFQLDYHFDMQILLDYYSGLSFLDLTYFGKFNDFKSFIIKNYMLDDICDSPLIFIDWDKTVNAVNELFDFVPNGNFVHIFKK